jgi:hypothetical protein
VVAQSVFLLGYGLDYRSSILGRGREFSLRHHVQTDSGERKVSCPIGTAAKGPGTETDHSPTANVEGKNEWSNTSIPPYIFMACYLIEHRGNFTFTF